MGIWDNILKKLEKNALHFALIDPDPLNQDMEELRERVKVLEDIDVDALMLGGSSGFGTAVLNNTIKEAKKEFTKPVILFPGNVSGISPYADAIFFMSLMNSRNPYWITGAQALGSVLVKRSGIEPIGMGYVVVEPGGSVSFVGDAKPVPRKKPEVAMSYALAAQYLGMDVIYLEAGSGAEKPVPAELVSMVDKYVDIPILVGGGIKDGKDAKLLVKAGADVIITGTVIEDEDEDKLRSINKALKSFKK